MSPAATRSQSSASACSEDWFSNGKVAKNHMAYAATVQRSTCRAAAVSAKARTGPYRHDTPWVELFSLGVKGEQPAPPSRSAQAFRRRAARSAERGLAVPPIWLN